MHRSATKSRLKSRTPEEVAAEKGIDLGRELTSGFAARVIRLKARQIARRAGFSKSDIEDHRQQLIQRVVENLAAFDPAQGHFNVFVTTVVERYVANILRDARANKRNRRQICSLSMIVDEDECGPVELNETIGQRELDSRLGIVTRDPYATSEVVMDVKEALADLPPKLRDLCERLQRGTISEVARELGVPRTLLYKSIGKLRKHFQKAGLKNYWKNFASTRAQTV